MATVITPALPHSPFSYIISEGHSTSLGSVASHTGLWAGKVVAGSCDHLPQCGISTSRHCGDSQIQANRQTRQTKPPLAVRRPQGLWEPVAALPPGPRCLWLVAFPAPFLRFAGGAELLHCCFMEKELDF